MESIVAIENGFSHVRRNIMNPERVFRELHSEISAASKIRLSLS